MNSFFYYQPELLSTINIITGRLIGSVGAVAVYAGASILLIIAGLLLARRYGWSKQNIIFLALTIGWLPLFLQFSYSSLREFDDTWIVLSESEEDKLMWRHCRIDQYQRLGGRFCGMYPFIEEAKARLPEGAEVRLVPSELGPYLMYYLYRDFGYVYREEAEYLLVYQPVEPVILTEEGRLFEGEKEIGRFEVVAAFAPDQAIFKRID